MKPCPKTDVQGLGSHRQAFLLFTLLTGFLCIAFALVNVRTESECYTERAREKATLLASLLARSIALPLYAESPTELTRHASELFSVPDVARVEIFNQQGKKLVDARPDSSMNNWQLISVTAPVAAAGLPTPDEALGISTPQPPALIGTVAITLSLKEKDRLVREVIVRTAVIALLFWAAVVAACYPLLRRLKKSFETFSSGLSVIGKGDFTTRLEADGPGEEGQAATAVNQLAEALKDREEENHTLHQELADAIEAEIRQEREMMIARLIQTNRMTSLGLLISSTAHNIHTPAGAIRLSAQYLRAAWVDVLPILDEASREEGDFSVGGLPFSSARDEVGEALKTVLDNVERIENIIQDLRTYNVGAGNPHGPGVDLNRVVRDALTVIRAHGNNGEITVSPDLAKELPEVTGNHHQLEQVVINLILNAIQATPGRGGIVTVRTSHVPEERQVLLSVIDRGEGVSAEAIPHLFEPFYSTRFEKGGSGLGLYISKFIITEHHGILELVPGAHGGTVASVRLPRTEDLATP